MIAAASYFLQPWERGEGGGLSEDADLMGGAGAAVGFKVFGWSYMFDLMTTHLNLDDTWGFSASGRFTQIGSEPPYFTAHMDPGPSLWFMQIPGRSSSQFPLTLLLWLGEPSWHICTSTDTHLKKSSHSRDPIVQCLVWALEELPQEFHHTRHSVSLIQRFSKGGPRTYPGPETLPAYPWDQNFL